MLLIIVATGNHFFVDAALGGLVVVIGWLIARAVVGVARPATAHLAPRRHVAPLTANRTPVCGEPHRAVARAARRHTSPPHRHGSRPVRACQENSPEGGHGMSPLKPSTNLAARMGRWSARNRKTAIFGWLAFVVAAVVGGTIGTKQLGDNDTLGRVGPCPRILEAFDQPAGDRPRGERDAHRRQPGLPGGRRGRRAACPALAVVANVESPYAAGNGGQISADRHSAIVSFDIRGDADDAVDKIDPVIDAVDAAAAAHPALSIDEFGVSAEKQLDDKFNKDLERAGLLSLPVTIVILVIAFGALVAAGIPLLALSAVMATMGLLAIPSHGPSTRTSARSCS